MLRRAAGLLSRPCRWQLASASRLAAGAPLRSAHRYAPGVWCSRELEDVGDGYVLPIYSIGIAQAATGTLGNIGFVDAANKGAVLEVGRPFSMVEGTAGQVTIESPISGEVVAVNHALIDDPGELNDGAAEEPDNWIIRVEGLDVLDTHGPANEVEVEEEWAALATSAVPLGSAGGPDRKGDAAIPDDDGEDDEDDAAEGVRSWWPGLASVAAGTKAVFKQQIVANDAYQRTAEDGYALPVFCVKGAQPGPTMLTLTGIHGDEYEPLAATHDLYAALDPAELSGTWLCVGPVSVSGYLAANRQTPQDGKNLARCFPGKAKGSLTERVAFTLSAEFISQDEVAAVVDLHSAGRIAKMVTLAGYNVYPAESDDTLVAKSQALARAMALPLVWGHHCDPDVCHRAALNDEAGSRTSLFASYLFRKPAVYCETTGTGGIRQADVDEYVEGLKRALAHLGILPTGHASVSAGQVRLDTVSMPAQDMPAVAGEPSTGHLQSQNLTPVGGVWRSRVDLWGTVVEGDLLGSVSDHFGTVVFELRAAQPGTVILLRHLARVDAGDFLAVIV